MGRVAATLASTLCLLIGMTSLAAAEDGKRDDDRDDRSDRSIERIEKHIIGKVLRSDYDGLSNDLLTAGLGATGLGLPAPAAANPASPTLEELRRLAIHNNYRALVDTSKDNGYGTLYGPTVGAKGQAAERDGKVAGTEYLALLDDFDGGNSRTTVALQVPETFDPANACMVTGTSSGSRGVYGAIGTSGEWGLKKGCAVVYTDKGTGTGFFDLENGKGYTVQGEYVEAATSVEPLNFKPRIPRRELEEYLKDNPNRWAIKHAHSRENPEAHWGTDTLHSIQFGFLMLNRHFANDKSVGKITPANTLVIASSVSNGGGAALRAAEEDEHGLIDGVAVSEPHVNPTRDRSFTIQQGSGQPLAEHGRPLYDYISLYALYEGCAAATPQNTRATQVCTDLKARGLLTDGTPDEAQAKLQQYGLLPEQNALAATYWTSNVYQAVAVAYANAYSKASVTDNLCGFSYAFVDAAGKPSAPLPPSNPALAFAGSNGIPPTIGIQLIRNGVSTTTAGTAPAPMADVDGAICLRNLWAGNNDAHRGRDDRDDRDPAKRLRKGVEDVLATAGLHGKPTVIVHGRSDALIAVNHSSRSYYGSALRKQQNIRYYEVTNAHHLDAFNGLLPGFSSAFIPLHVYFIEGLDRLYAHLKDGKDLPPSQVVHTFPRGTAAPPLTQSNVPPIAETARPKDLIVFTGSALQIPD